MMLGDADPVEPEFVGHCGVAEPALKALVRDMRIAFVRQDPGPVSTGASVMSAAEDRGFHAKGSTVRLPKLSGRSFVQLIEPEQESRKLIPQQHDMSPDVHPIGWA